MKRKTLIERIENEARELFGENIKVCTYYDIYPRCYLCTVGDGLSISKRLSPDMRPSELLMFIRGINFAINKSDWKL